ncbi:unnamed protein product [Adineta ricciae]|uniref:Uncharacterized protein n=1 Tax=Adineta ricciae TaxID=249248 RepID=A0A815XKF3_ADIRI|nr:unnamed protein product [Adineta ricciae]CAF1558634.1 unnamed protein product [Adineta ricciae]
MECKGVADMYPAFVVPELIHEVIFVNQYMSMEAIDRLLNHISDCYQFSVDTEGEVTNNRLAIIQIHTIPRTLPSMVILLELCHLPSPGSEQYAKIEQILRLTFRSDNYIYAWGDMRKELEPVNHLLDWPIRSELINLQPHFAGWYEWARTLCRVQNLQENVIKVESNEINRSNDPMKCTCHRESPYHESQLWSLQNALIYGFDVFIDKTARMAHWSHGLTYSHSSLSHAQRIRMIHYAKNDVMAVTYLVRPIVERWSFTRIKETKIEARFTAFEPILPAPLRQSSTKRKVKNLDVQKLAKIFETIDPDIESISSDDEIYLNQVNQDVTQASEEHVETELATATNDNINDDLIEPTNGDLVDISDDEIIIRNIGTQMDNDDVTTTQYEMGSAEVIWQDPVIIADGNYEAEERTNRSKHQQRSIKARNRKNNKHNKQRRKHRYRHFIKRRCYYRFTMYEMKKILRYYGITFTHVKFDETSENLIIGLKNEENRSEAEHQLAIDIFNRRSYYHYRRRQYHK